MKNEIQDVGKSVIDLQIKALKKLKYSLDNSFNKVVNAISKCKSKVIICGVGKSGIIASKISATLSSVGTPSFPISEHDLVSKITTANQENDVNNYIDISSKKSERDRISNVKTISGCFTGS